MEKKEIIPGGWISQKEAANTQHYRGLVEDFMEDKEMITGPTTKPSSHRYLKLFKLVLSWKGPGISLLATIFGVIALQLYLICFSFLCLRQP